ncbi:hypothetical protein Tsubulata_022834 [Turnera subulata]|uniref:PPIase cyclophilin-type domain-containing protein n=1 Tax=Turnera subulata TaxID=218843 RepID=A0A9Q0JK58_9ROSI|nr:hypothetical protein Tsubulata_022834 [Turnera subulata]
MAAAALLTSISSEVEILAHLVTLPPNPIPHQPPGLAMAMVRPNFFCGGDVVENDGTSGESIFGKDFYEQPGTSFGGRDALSMCYIDGWMSSQFLISFTETGWMGGHYPVFGKVVDGIGLLEDIEAAADEYGRPVKEETIAGCGVC